RAQGRGARALSAAAGGARHRCHFMGWAVRPVRAARCPRADARAFRCHFGRQKIDMTARHLAVAFAAAVALAGCGNTNEAGFQGWVEADLIFVSPDEVGRVETLSVREGDAVTQGAPLFSVDPDLQQADVQMAEASLTNARQAYDRAQALLKTSAGTQRAVDDAEAALRTA